MSNLCVRLAGASLAMATLLSACGQPSVQSTRAVAEVSIRETVQEADPKGAADAIYAFLAVSPLPQALTDRELGEYYDISTADVTSFLAFHTDAKDGLCDIAIIAPVNGNRDKIRDQLYLYKDQRMEEFRNYDILDAFTIAQNAVVLDQGDYLVLLMLPDNEEVRDLLDEYIPQ